MNLAFCHTIPTISAYTKANSREKPLMSEIYKNPPLISYKRGRSFKDILVRAKL